MGGMPPLCIFPPPSTGQAHQTLLPLLAQTRIRQATRLNLVLHADDAADALPLRHQVEGLVDLREWDAVRNELLHLQLLHANKAES